jgi:hypothetical protein
VREVQTWDVISYLNSKKIYIMLMPQEEPIRTPLQENPLLVLPPLKKILGETLHMDTLHEPSQLCLWW